MTRIIHEDDQIVFLGYSRNQLKAAFELVKPAQHWKYPIDAVVPKTADIAAIEAAIGFFCGGETDVIEVANGYRVTAPGYFALIGA